MYSFHEFQKYFQESRLRKFSLNVLHRDDFILIKNSLVNLGENIIFGPICGTFCVVVSFVYAIYHSDVASAYMLINFGSSRSTVYPGRKYCSGEVFCKRRRRKSRRRGSRWPSSPSTFIRIHCLHYE